MTNKEMEELTNKMQEKLGQENASIIADDLATLITDNSTMNDDLKNKDNEINKLKDDKELLYQANGNLLKQISMSNKEEKEDKKDEENKDKKISYKEIFDDKGNFLK